MEIQLISGVFSIAEAEQLLTEIFQTKIRFHENRIKTITDTEEDIEHSERRIIQLQQTLRNAIDKLKQSGKTSTSLNAFIEVNTADRLTQ